MELVKEALSNIIAKLDKLHGVVSMNKKKEADGKEGESKVEIEIEDAKLPENILGSAMNEEESEDGEVAMPSNVSGIAHKGKETPAEEAAEEVAVHGEGDVPEEDQGNEDPLEAIFKKAKQAKNA